MNMLAMLMVFGEVFGRSLVQIISRLAKTAGRHLGTKRLGALRRIVFNLLKINLSDTRSLPKKRRRAMLGLTYRDSLLSLA